MFQLLGSVIPNANVHRGLVLLLIAAMSFNGYGFLKQQWNVKGEYSNYPQEDLLDWINDNTPEGWLFIAQHTSTI